MEIIFQDENIIVINKPPGVSAHGGETVSGPTVADFLLPQFPEISTVGDDPINRPGIVHRLDKDTSGLMVVARNQPTFETLKELFKTRSVEKIYWGVVCGTPRDREGVVSAPIGRLVRQPMKRGVEQGRSRIRGARDAVTHYRVLKHDETYALVELKPKTGRMHQLRVHMKSIGHPIACDQLYGGKNVCCPEGCHRQLLHARSLSFSFPEGRRLSFEADVPEDFPNF
ncbi:MAG: RluA family pseudouridine synthase [bacterium]|nr:RluA family pseudouridine synthase [bacterium]